MICSYVPLYTIISNNIVKHCHWQTSGSVLDAIDHDSQKRFAVLGIKTSPQSAKKIVRCATAVQFMVRNGRDQFLADQEIRITMTLIIQ